MRLVRALCATLLAGSCLISVACGTSVDDPTGVSPGDPPANASYSVTVQSTTGTITAKELSTFKTFMQHETPTADNLGNSWTFGAQGYDIEGLGLMYEVTGDRDLLDLMVKFTDSLLFARNSTTTGLIQWTGKRELCWPYTTSTTDGGGPFNGFPLSHLAYTAKLILKGLQSGAIVTGSSPTSTWGDPYSYGSTYSARALKYIAEADRTISTFIAPNFVSSASGTLYQYWLPTSTAAFGNVAGLPVPWNQQAMLNGAFQRLAESHAILGDATSTVATYDAIVLTNLLWFKSQTQSFSTNGHAYLQWAYRANDLTLHQIEAQDHAEWDVMGMLSSFNSDRKYGVFTRDDLLKVVNTVEYVMASSTSPGVFSGYVNGTSDASNGARTGVLTWLLLLGQVDSAYYNLVAPVNAANKNGYRQGLNTAMIFYAKSHFKAGDWPVLQ